ncbi:MAG: hypothetical protein E7662_04580 [Ruminococcaceae bacterium]|nr:hypothetical protein [Oscillospiraceae bacterium]
MSAKAIRILRIVLCAAVVIYVLVRVGGCVFRWTTARFEGTKLIIGGVTYIHKEFDYTETDRTIAYVDGWTVSTIKEDPSRTFLRVRSFLDGYGYMREDYEIPTEGEITVIYLDDRHRYTSRRMCGMIADLQANPPQETFTIRTDAIYRYTKSVSVGYEDCPIATDFVGYLGQINGEWVFIFPTEIRYDNGYVERDFVCHIIPEKYDSVLSLIPYIENTELEAVS